MKRFEVYRPRYVTVASRFQMMLRPWWATLDGRRMGEDPSTYWTWADARRGAVGVIARTPDGDIETTGEGRDQQVVITALHGSVEIQGKTAGELAAAVAGAIKQAWLYRVKMPVRQVLHRYRLRIARRIAP